METEKLPIKDFKVGDRFLWLDKIFEVSGDLEIVNDSIGGTLYRNPCKCLSDLSKLPSVERKVYHKFKAMQGTSSVMFERIIR